MFSSFTSLSLRCQCMLAYEQTVENLCIALEHSSLDQRMPAHVICFHMTLRL